MSYVQGTVVIVTAEFSDPDTGNAVDPPDVVASAWAPSDADADGQAFSHTAGTIAKLATGRYRFLIDTAAEDGDWIYEIAGTGPEAIVKRRILRVTPRRSVAALV